MWVMAKVTGSGVKIPMIRVVTEEMVVPVVLGGGGGGGGCGDGCGGAWLGSADGCRDASRLVLIMVSGVHDDARPFLALTTVPRWRCNSTWSSSTGASPRLGWVGLWSGPLPDWEQHEALLVMALAVDDSGDDSCGEGG